MTPIEHLLGETVVSFRASLGPAMEITDQNDADRYLTALINYHERLGKVSHEAAVHMAKVNLGYYAGYHDQETMSRVNRLFDTQHPIFGTSTPTAEEAIETGKRMATGGGRWLSWLRDWKHGQ